MRKAAWVFRQETCNSSRALVDPIQKLSSKNSQGFKCCVILGSFILVLYPKLPTSPTPWPSFDFYFFLYFGHTLVALAPLRYFLVIALGSERLATHHQDINKQDHGCCKGNWCAIVERNQSWEWEAFLKRLLAAGTLRGRHPSETSRMRRSQLCKRQVGRWVQSEGTAEARILSRMESGTFRAPSWAMEQTLDSSGRMPQGAGVTQP